MFRSAECGGREVQYYDFRRFVRGFTMVWGREYVSHSILKLLKDRRLNLAGAEGVVVGWTLPFFFGTDCS
jgi:hypothetical protein